MTDDQINRAVILPAQPGHLAAIAALAEVVWRAYYPGIISVAQIDYMLARMYDLDVMRQEMANGISYDRLLVDEALVGFASYGPVGVDGEMKLHKLYLHPTWQRRGLGSRLVRHVEHAARQRSCPALSLSVNKANHQAIAVYRKNGFTIREPVVVDIGGGFVMNDYVMAKRL
ncbi:MAG: GNAT family N-acetyltransferase [Limisphaerales bacterium]